MSVIVTAIFHPVEGRKAELSEALVATIPAVHQEKGCQLYAIHDAEDGTITMIEKWSTADDLAAHSAGAATRALGAAVAPFISAPVTVTTMRSIPAGTPEQGAL